MIREEIIKYLSTSTYTDGHYNLLKQCIEIDMRSIPPGDVLVNMNAISSRVDDWFRGVIYSLYYRPNHNVLVLVGNQGIGKTQFFRLLLPNPDWFHEEMLCIGDYFKYEKLIISFEEGMEKKQLNLPMEDNFLVKEYKITEISAMSTGGYEIGGNIVSSDKRLASYCSTTNVWRHPPRKNFIILNVESINQELYNSIDKHLLWIEIFNKFKPLDKWQAQ